MGDREDTEALAWGDMPYDGKNPRQVVDDYVLVRGDLVAEYAREQLANWIERYAAARVAEALAPIEALGGDGSPGSLMEDIRSELTALTGIGPALANACTTRVMHQVREHVRAALPAPDPTEEGA